MHVLAGEVVGVFAHVESADEHRAGRFQPLDQRRIFGGRRVTAINLRAGDRGNPGDVEQVFGRERHTSEPVLFFDILGCGIDRACLAARALDCDSGEGIERRIELGNTC